MTLYELISFIEEFNDGTNGVFKLSELVHMYSTHLEELGASKTRVNNTKLKEKLLASKLELEENKGSKHVSVIQYS